MAFPRFAKPPEWGAAPVPPEARTLRTFDIAVLWSSLGVGLLVLSAGSLLFILFGLNMVEVIVVSAVGSVIGSLMLAAAAKPGSAHGVPTMVSLRPILGHRGSWAPSVVNAFQLLGWAAFELLVMGFAAAALSQDFLGPLTAIVLVPVFAAVVLALAWLGPLRVIRGWLERFAFWIMLGTTALIAFSLLTQPRDLSVRGNPSAYTGVPSLLLALDLVIVMPISWWPLISDYNRFARSPRASTLGTVIGYASSNTAFYTLGAGLSLFLWLDPTVAFPNGDPIAALAQLALGSIVLLVILGDETDNAFANVYSTAVSVQNVAPRLKQRHLIVVATAIALGVALWLNAAGEGLGGPYELFLLLIGGIFVPLLGVVVADAFVLRRAGYRLEEFEGGSPAVRIGAFVAWGAGSALYFAAVWMLIPGFPPIGATLPAFAAAAALHIALGGRARPPKAAVAPAEPAKLPPQTPG